MIKSVLLFVDIIICRIVICRIIIWTAFTLFILVRLVGQIKNDDSVKEAPAYCQSFLDGLHIICEVGKAYFIVS